MMRRVHTAKPRGVVLMQLRPGSRGSPGARAYPRRRRCSRAAFRAEIQLGRNVPWPWGRLTQAIATTIGLAHPTELRRKPIGATSASPLRHAPATLPRRDAAYEGEGARAVIWVLRTAWMKKLWASPRTARKKRRTNAILAYRARSSSTSASPRPITTSANACRQQGRFLVPAITAYRGRRDPLRRTFSKPHKTTWETRWIWRVGRRAEARWRAYERAIAMNPTSGRRPTGTVRLGAADCRGTIGQAVGLSYEWRKCDCPGPAAGSVFRRPQWGGRKISAGRTILLQAEHGIGRHVQLPCDPVPLVAGQGRR